MILLLSAFQYFTRHGCRYPVFGVAGYQYQTSESVAVRCIPTKITYLYRGFDILLDHAGLKHSQVLVKTVLTQNQTFCHKKKLLQTKLRCLHTHFKHSPHRSIGPLFFDNLYGRGCFIGSLMLPPKYHMNYHCVLFRSSRTNNYCSTIKHKN
jgi:hypothetical protein